jgi:hypothetical protein
MSDMYLKVCLQEQWRTDFNFDATLPADCSACRGADGGGLGNLLPYYAAKYPDERMGLLSTTQDDTIRSFFGYGYSATCDVPIRGGMPPADFEAGLLELRTIDTSANFHTFYMMGTQHTFLYDDLDAAMVGGITLRQWITELVDADPAWNDVGP